MLSSACSWNSCQSPMRWPGARASGNSRGYSMKPVGLPMTRNLKSVTRPNRTKLGFQYFLQALPNFLKHFFRFKILAAMHLADLSQRQTGRDLTLGERIAH